PHVDAGENDVDLLPHERAERDAVGRRAVDAEGVDSVEDVRRPGTYRPGGRDRLARGGLLDVGSDYPHLAECARGLREDGDSRAVDTVIVDDEDPHTQERSLDVLLLHNPSAGDDGPSGEELVELIERAGHRVSRQSTGEARWRSTLEAPRDLVAIAGGDGTVADAMIALASSAPRLASVLPLGSANNIAWSLGVAEIGIEELVARWPSAARRPYRLGRVDDLAFAETVGGGLFAAAIERADARKDDE